ncbi:4Fe-4S dicluster domain-containing protein [Desulfonatronum thiosulfatophilum]|uniref:4Fe-4S dicluster domain-containing protein n=1 Tax=Desulfonatronum thiosulfatophilum TaxID=617002 RepID=A0A1G6B036_9BACT|nr:4Fe-4S dicluster domain-containing protein [Desulfonatronum thiosulfatophilum]SDB14050.1 4Fe-4S dicluster domain-containing protein [Desulfonatronum thiosulfatophilum]
MTILTQLKEQIAAQLPKLDMVIGWEQGFDPLHATPLFMRGAEDVERLQIGPLAVHNTATYLTGLKNKKVGLVVKGCDSRAVVQLVQEGLINQENIVVFGFPCEGVADLTKVRRRLGDIGRVNQVDISPDSLRLHHDGQETDIPLADVLADKCLRCRFPNALVHDHFAGKPREPHAATDDYQDVQDFESQPLEDRFEHWKEEMSRCIRCYACRNACPMCVCRDHCVAQSREPHWVTQEDEVREKWMFQVIHAMHLAGRCVECGECQRACPVDIPVLALKRKLNKEIKELFNYEAGVDPKAIPPLLSFQVEEENINERGW